MLPRARSLFVAGLSLLSLSLPCSASPAAARDNSWVGINLWPIADWSTEWVFVDAFKHARSWIPQEVSGYIWDTGQPLALTPEGWPLLAPGQAAGTLLCRELGGHYPGGEYTALWDGSGEVEFHFDAEVTQTWPGGAKMTVTPSDAGIHVKVVASNTSDPVRNIRVLMPGFESNYATQIFHPLFLERLRGFTSLRFMDWQETNNSLQVNWNQRPRTDYFTQAGDSGVALEYMIALCNRLHCDPWFCMPHMATDAYVASFATLVEQQLDPDLRVYIEYSNEVWNPIFEQAQWAFQHGNALNLSSNEYQAQLFYHSLRSVEVFGVWESVFGGTGRLVRVLGSHSANPWTGEQIMSYQDAWQHADALGIAPYFGGTLGSGTQAATTITWNVEQVLDACDGLMQGTLASVAQNQDNAAQHGLALMAYEGGQHLVGVGSWITNQTLQNLFTEANRHPRMGELYERYLQGWEELGGSTFCAFSSCVTPSLFGQWGAMEWQDQPIAEAHKYRALRQAIWRSSAEAPTPSCSSRPTSAGVPAALGYSGTSSVVLDDLQLEASDGLGNFGVFFLGVQLQPVPFGDGVLCIAPPTTRLAVRPIQAGLATLGAAPSQLPLAVDAGTSLQFQFWFRDPAGGPAGFNFSNALGVTYAP